MSSTIEIRVLHTIDEMKQVQILEDTIWKGDSIPTHQTITAVKNGGILLGAYIQDQLVGFSYGFAGFSQGKSYLCSHNMGIHSDYRDAGIGATLKEAQKNTALQMGYDLITWTYDPLESRNGYLNLAKLGAICNTYVENCYGELEDGLNNGLPTDRFKVEWWIDSEHVSLQLQKNIGDDCSAFAWRLAENGLPMLEEFSSVKADGQTVIVPVPTSIQHVKAKDPSLAFDWRMKTRNIFQTLFGQGYSAVLLRKSTDEPVHYYVLVKRNTLQLHTTNR